MNQGLKVKIKRNVSLSPFTTFKIGGRAEYFAEVKNKEEVKEAIKFAKEKKLPIFILGGGSNILISDKGFKGLVIKNSLNFFAVKKIKNKAHVRVGSGEKWDVFVERAVRAGWGGIENLSGVPGTIGAAPVQNIGCYGQSAEEAIAAVKALDIASGKMRTFSRGDCKFGYRTSIFRKQKRKKYFIMEVVFDLKIKGGPNTSSYPDIEKYFAGKRKQPSLKAMRKAIIEIRDRKGMIIKPGHGSYMSAGSFFKNPVVKKSLFKKIFMKIHDEDGGTSNWFWNVKNGRVKISAARLIEESGFKKGFRRKNVGISPRQALAIINCGGAKAKEIRALAREIQRGVGKKFGVFLEPEVEFVGF